MRDLWQSSLLARTVGNIIAITVLVGGLIMLVMSTVVARQTEAAAYRRLSELLDTVESTVRIACFVGDEELATEVARGLLKSSEVMAIGINSDKSELVFLNRVASPTKKAGFAANPLKRSIYSPFDNGKIVGSITLQPDDQAIAALIGDARQQMVLQMAMLILVVAIALTLTVLRQVVQPIAGLSRRLTKLDPTSGERLAAPLSHEHNAFGSLTRDINALSARLVSTIETEQLLHRQHEMDERKYRGIFENAESGIFIADHRGDIESYNRSMSRLTGLPEPAAAEDWQHSLTTLPWAEADHLARLIKGCVERNLALTEDLELCRPAAASRWLNIALTSIGNNLVQGIVSDVTARRSAEVAAQRMAVTDQLTGLANRLGFEERCAAAIEARPEQTFALLMIDLEGFRQLNDALGFPAGDQVLIGLGARISSSVKSSDWVARIGGDEFAVVLSNVHTPATLENICQRILDSLSERFSLNGQEACLGASIGATFYPADGSQLPTLLRNAELALNDARACGGKIWRVFDPKMIHAAEHRHNLASDLRLAIERNELRLYYQPIIDLKNQHVVGAEALIRWFHPSQGMIPPDNFIPLAEQTGLINEIGEWCLTTACRQLSEWLSVGRNLYLTVNVSARQIPDGLPPARISAIAASHGIAPQRLGLEITEGLLLGEAGGALNWLEAIRAAGFRAYLDDFGTGYSSLSYLKRFRVDTVKIDRAFIRDICEVASDRVMVEAVVMMADSLQLSVVAEGIENQAQLDTLRCLGCTYGQGYHFSRPLPDDQFLDQVDRINASLAPVCHASPTGTAGKSS
jgi:diguanylate cyclase (GGDEF)-like protein/PAS domain S-box-containing protein